MELNEKQEKLNELRKEFRKDLLSDYDDKIEFVNKLGEVLSKKLHYGIPSTYVSKLDYDIFMDEYGFVIEYLIVTYIDSTIAVKNCTGNSISAIFEDAYDLFENKSTNEIPYYKEVKKKAIAKYNYKNGDFLVLL